MFTGIVEELGEVVDAVPGRIVVRASAIIDDALLGDSVAVNGVDLTVHDMDGPALAFHVMPETYRMTTLGALAPAERVNLERSVRASDRMSGHVVRGVVEGTGRVESFEADGDATIVTYAAPADVCNMIVERGPVAVDGISLTVIRKRTNRFSVSIVRYTAEHTNVLAKAVGDPVNIETDIMQRYAAQAVATGVRPEPKLAPIDVADRVEPARYDQIGAGYAVTRREDPRIAAQIHAALGVAQTVVNVGAGAGSYEPRDRDVIAVEPSGVMIAQRDPHLRPAIRAGAYPLPLADRCVDAAMAVLTIHHWDLDQERGVRELRRVARGPVVILTFDPEMSGRMWLMADYLPEVADLDRQIFPSPDSIAAWLGGQVDVSVVPLSRDTPDWMLGSFWSHPERVLDTQARAATSGFARMDPNVVRRVVQAVERDLADGSWDARHGHLRELDEFDAGLRLVVGNR